MRTKTLALSALLGALTTVTSMAQVYSQNGVGYINVSFPPGTYTIVTCPLICSPNNTLSNIFPNTGGAYTKAQVYPFVGGNYGTTEQGVKVGASQSNSGWSLGGGDITMNPGQAVFFYNSGTTLMTNVFVGQIPTGTNMTNLLGHGYNLVGSIVPTFGDIASNVITHFTNQTLHDSLVTFDTVSKQYDAADQVVKSGAGSGYNRQWTLGDPVTTNVTQGFFYFNNNANPNTNWVETFSINETN